MTSFGFDMIIATLRCALMPALICTAAVANPSPCKDRTVSESTLTNDPDLSVRATSCAMSPERYKVELLIVKGSDILQRYWIEAEGLAYVLLVDTTMDLDGDGISDIGISTGKGRAGDGMSYWLTRRNPTRLVLAGEAPGLSWSKTGRKVLFSLVPGSGDIQSTRQDYQVKNEKLQMIRETRFHVRTDDRYLVQSTSFYKNKVSRTIRSQILVRGAQICMDGGPCPL